MMAQKKLEPDSQYNKYDLDGDGIVTDEELAMEERMMRLENEDQKQDAQRYMAWFALWGILLYPIAIILCALTGQEQGGSLLADIAPTYFVAAAGLVAAFFGANAIAKKNGNGK